MNAIAAASPREREGKVDVERAMIAAGATKASDALREKTRLHLPPDLQSAEIYVCESQVEGMLGPCSCCIKADRTCTMFGMEYLKKDASKRLPATPCWIRRRCLPCLIDDIPCPSRTFTSSQAWQSIVSPRFPDQLEMRRTKWTNPTGMAEAAIFLWNRDDGTVEGLDMEDQQLDTRTKVFRSLRRTAKKIIRPRSHSAATRSANQMTRDERASPPDKATTPSGEATTPPDEATTPPDEATTPPDEATTPPDEATTPPDEATTPPDEATTPPVEAGAQPAPEPRTPEHTVSSRITPKTPSPLQKLRGRVLPTRPRIPSIFLAQTNQEPPTNSDGNDGALSASASRIGDSDDSGSRLHARALDTPDSSPRSPSRTRQFLEVLTPRRRRPSQSVSGNSREHRKKVQRITEVQTEEGYEVGAIPQHGADQYRTEENGQLEVQGYDLRNDPDDYTAAADQSRETSPSPTPNITGKAPSLLEYGGSGWSSSQIKTHLPPASEQVFELDPGGDGPVLASAEDDMDVDTDGSSDPSRSDHWPLQWQPIQLTQAHCHDGSQNEITTEFNHGVQKTWISRERDRLNNLLNAPDDLRIATIKSTADERWSDAAKAENMIAQAMRAGMFEREDTVNPDVDQADAAVLRFESLAL